MRSAGADPGLRILLVEDNPGDRDLLLDVLDDAGERHQVTWVPTLARAREELAEGDFELGVLDLGLPDSQGLETLDAALEAAPDLPLVVLTGDSAGGHAAEAIRRGAQDYLVKGVLHAEVVERVFRHAVGRHQAQARERHLNRVLRVLRSISQLSAREKSAEELCQKACESLYEHYAYQGVWIALDQGPGRIPLLVMRGEGDHAAAFHESISQGNIPGCWSLLEARPGVVEWVEDSEICRSCPLRTCPQGDHLLRLVVRLCHRGTCFGLLGLSLPERPFADFRDEEERLVEEVARDLAFALHDLRLGQDHRAAEEELHLLAQAMEQSREIVVITDLEGTIRYVNAAFERITGYTRAETLGENPRILKSGVHDAAFYQSIWTSILSGRTWSGRIVNRKKDGTHFTEDALISPIHGETGKISFFLAVKRDITDHLEVLAQKEQLQEQVWRSQRLESVGQLAGGIAHDFNNLLGVILGYGEELQDELHEADPRRECVDQIVVAGERAATLTRQLLAFSRRQTLLPRRLELNQVVRDLEKMLRRLIGEGIEYRSELASDLGVVEADPGQVEQVIVNIVVNARDALGGTGKLVLETRNVVLDEDFAASREGCRPGDYVLLSIQDDGKGMDRETQARIFEPFFSTKAVGQGTGLGLATVYGIVKQSGGNVWVRSELGQGSTFEVFLPRVDGVQESSDPPPPKPVESGCGQRILVVEDEPALRSLCRRILEGLNYRVEVARDGQEALDRVLNQGLEIDLLVSDVVMPRMGGKALAERLRQARPGLEVLFISGYTDDSIVAPGGFEDDVAFLQKPFSARSLGEAVARLLRDTEGDGDSTPSR